MAPTHASKNKNGGPVKASRRDHSVPARRHLPRQFQGYSKFFLVENRKKNGRCFLISRAKGLVSHVLSKSSEELQHSNSGEASLANTSFSKTDTSVTTLQSERDVEETIEQPDRVKEPSAEFTKNIDLKDDDSEESCSGNPITSEESTSTQENEKKPLIFNARGPQDVDVLQTSEYMIKLCREYKPSCRNDDELMEKMIDWVHGKNGNFVVPAKEGGFEVASSPKVRESLQRIIESATQKKPRAPKPLPKKPKGGKKSTSALSGKMAAGEHDVICGRGNATAFHSGNLHFRRYCWDLRDEYRKLPKHKKRSVAATIINRVKSTGGRFLEIQNGALVLASEARALEKAAQALREKKWENRNSRLDPNYREKSSSPTESKVQSDTPPKPSKVKLPKVSKPKKPPTAKLAPSWHEQSVAKSSENETSKSMHNGVEVGTRIEVFWPLDQKYYAAMVKAVNGHSVHIEYELDGVIEWLNLSDHIFRTIP